MLQHASCCMLRCTYLCTASRWAACHRPGRRLQQAGSHGAPTSACCRCPAAHPRPPGPPEVRQLPLLCPGCFGRALKRAGTQLCHLSLHIVPCCSPAAGPGIPGGGSAARAAPAAVVLRGTRRDTQAVLREPAVRPRPASCCHPQPPLPIPIPLLRATCASRGVCLLLSPPRCCPCLVACPTA